jgi:hypothetical protein
MQMRPKLERVDGVRLVADEAAAADEPPSPALAARVSGVCKFLEPTTGQPVDGIVDGSLTVTEFRAPGGALQLAGTLAGTCTADEVTGSTFSQEIAIPVVTVVTRAPGSCRTLRVLVGPMDVDRPEFAVHTAELVIAVTATTGQGNLLGNLLGAIGNSLSSDAPASHVAELLNHVVALAG